MAAPKLGATTGNSRWCIMSREYYSMGLPQGIYECQPEGGIAHSLLPLLQLPYRGTKMVEGEDEREGEREEGRRRRGRKEKKEKGGDEREKRGGEEGKGKGRGENDEWEAESSS